MGLLIYGVNKATIGLEESFIKCPSCETYNWADIMVMSHYFLFYWIPVFPTDKDAIVICKVCGLKRDGMAFNENLINNYEERKSNFKHPWFTYIGVAFLIFIFVAILLAASF